MESDHETIVTSQFTVSANYGYQCTYLWIYPIPQVAPVRIVMIGHPDMKSKYNVAI